MTDTKEDYKHLRSFAEELPPRGSRFLAVGWGCYGAFHVRDTGLVTRAGKPWSIITKGEELRGVFEPLGFSHWIPLDDASFWGES